MATDTEIPELKLAKVGDKRRKRDKGGALLGFGGAGARGAAGFGSAGGAGLLGSAVAKIAIVALVASLGVGAYNLGVGLRPDDSQFAAKKKAKPFAAEAKPKYEGDLSQLPASAKPQGDSLSMVSGSMGENPEQQAAQNAQADQNKPAAEPTPPPDASAVPAGMNPADMAAAAAKAAGGQGGEAAADKDKKKNPFSTRFGSLSSSLGGQSGLAGGAGLSGGIGRGFEMPKFASSPGRITGFRSAARAPAAASRVNPSRARRGALGQLKKANDQSRLARTLTGEGSAEKARLAFEQNSGAQAPLSGLGTGMGRSPSDHTDTPTNPSVGGGPTESMTPTGSGNNNNNNNGDNGGHEKTAWKKWVDLASKLLLLASGLLILAVLLAHYQFMPHYLAIVHFLGWAVMAIGAIVAGIGLALIGMGQYLQGSMFTALGAVNVWAGHIVTTFIGGSAGVVAWKELFTHRLIGYFGVIVLGALGGGAMGGLGSSGASHHWDA